jgi:hypothetical protein
MVDWNCTTSIQDRMELIDLGLSAIDDPTDPFYKELGQEWRELLARQGELIKERIRQSQEAERKDPLMYFTIEQNARAARLLLAELDPGTGAHSRISNRLHQFEEELNELQITQQAKRMGPRFIEEVDSNGLVFESYYI